MRVDLGPERFELILLGLELLDVGLVNQGMDPLQHGVKGVDQGAHLVISAGNHLQLMVSDILQRDFFNGSGKLRQG